MRITLQRHMQSIKYWPSAWQNIWNDNYDKKQLWSACTDVQPVLSLCLTHESMTSWQMIQTDKHRSWWEAAMSGWWKSLKVTHVFVKVLFFLDSISLHYFIDVMSVLLPCHGNKFHFNWPQDSSSEKNHRNYPNDHLITAYSILLAFFILRIQHSWQHILSD